MITIRTLASASAQAVFDQLAEHLLNMEMPCCQANGVIGAYHFGDRRSPAGSLVADEDYLMCMENRSWWSLAATGLVPEAHADMIGDIEYVHDSFAQDDWCDHLIAVAHRHGVSARHLLRSQAA